MLGSVFIWPVMMTEKTEITMRKPNYWVIANAIGILCFIYFSSKLWAPPGESGLLGGPGDAFIWTLTVLPVILIFLVANVVWLVRSLFRIRKGGARGLFVWALVLAVWLVAFGYDRYRSYDGSEIPPDTSAISK